MPFFDGLREMGGGGGRQKKETLCAEGLKPYIAIHCSCNLLSKLFFDILFFENITPRKYRINAKLNS